MCEVLVSVSVSVGRGGTALTSRALSKKQKLLYYNSKLSLDGADARTLLLLVGLAGGGRLRARARRSNDLL